VTLAYAASAKIPTFSRTRSTKGTALPAVPPFGERRLVAGASSTIKGRLFRPKVMGLLLAHGSERVSTRKVTSLVNFPVQRVTDRATYRQPRFAGCSTSGTREYNFSRRSLGLIIQP